MNNKDWIIWDGIDIDHCSNDGIEIHNGADDNIIRNVEIQSCGDRGIFITSHAASNNRITISNVTIHNIDKDGIMVGGNDVTIQYCSIYDVDNGGVGADGDIIHFQPANGNLIVEYCDLNYDNPFGNNKQAIILNNGDGGGTDHVVIRNNKIVSSFTGINGEGNGIIEIYNNEIYSGISMDSGPYIAALNIDAVHGMYDDVQIWNNLISSDGSNEHFYGININEQNVNLYNNIIYGNQYSFQTQSSTVGNTITAYNNIFFPKSVAVRLLDADWTWIGDNNLYWDDGGSIPSGFWSVSGCSGLNDVGQWASCVGGETNSISANPLFINPSANDFHLQSGSPAIDAGVEVGLTTDFDGNPIVGIPDIGAFEYQGLISNCSLADTNQNSIVEIGELLTYISSWKTGSVSIGELLTAISEWKNGC